MAHRQYGTILKPRKKTTYQRVLGKVGTKMRCQSSIPAGETYGR